MKFPFGHIGDGRAVLGELIANPMPRLVDGGGQRFTPRDTKILKPALDPNPEGASLVAVQKFALLAKAKHRHYHDLNFQRTKCGARDDRNTGLLVAVSLDFRTFAI